MKNLGGKNFIIALAISLVCITIAVVIINSKPVKYFNKVELTNTTLIRNITKFPYLDTLVKVGLQELEINPRVIQIRPMVGKEEIGDKDLVAYIIGDKQRGYIIFVKSFSRDKMIGVFAHELIHLLDRELEIALYFDKHLIYDKKIYYKGEFPPYELRPWEHKAYFLAPLLEKKMKEALYSE